MKRARLHTLHHVDSEDSGEVWKFNPVSGVDCAFHGESLRKILSRLQFCSLLGIKHPNHGLWELSESYLVFLNDYLYGKNH